MEVDVEKDMRIVVQTSDINIRDAVARAGVCISFFMSRSSRSMLLQPIEIDCVLHVSYHEVEMVDQERRAIVVIEMHIHQQYNTF